MANNSPPIIEGNPNARHYKDMLGRELSVGDYFVHSTAQSSTVYVNIYKIVKFVDLSTPSYIGCTPLPEGRRIESWDTAFKLKAIRMDLDRAMGTARLPKVYVKSPVPPYGEWKDVPEDQHKASTISAVERIVRVELDV